jgi:hypothetical protein
MLVFDGMLMEIHLEIMDIPSGNLAVCHGKLPFSIGISSN